MTQQEQEAIEAYAKEIMKSGCVSNERDFLDGMLKGAEFALSVFRKTVESEPIGRTNEELIQRITALIWEEAYSTEKGEQCAVYDNDFDYIAKNIAKLLPSIPTYYPYDIEMFQELFSYMYDNHHVTLLDSEMDEIMRICLKIIGGKVVAENQENDMNVELLKTAKDALKTFYRVGCTDEAEIVQELKEAIANIEKQKV